MLLAGGVPMPIPITKFSLSSIEEGGTNWWRRILYEIYGMAKRKGREREGRKYRKIFLFNIKINFCLKRLLKYIIL
jgi:hypothetical protein